MGILRMLFRLLAPSNRTARPNFRDRSALKQSATGPTLVRYADLPAMGLHTAQAPRATVVGACFVIDGDSLAIGNAMIRLAGIDAPELDQPWGQKAKWALVALTKGQVVRAELDGTLSYDRTVAHCYLPDGRDLSLEMVKMGLALDWSKFSAGNYREFEPPGIRKKLWRVDAKHKGRFPPTT